MVTGTGEAAQWMGGFKTPNVRCQNVGVWVCLFPLQTEQIQAVIQVLKRTCWAIWDTLGNPTGPLNFLGHTHEAHMGVKSVSRGPRHLLWSLKLRCTCLQVLTQRHWNEGSGWNWVWLGCVVLLRVQMETTILSSWATLLIHRNDWHKTIGRPWNWCKAFQIPTTLLSSTWTRIATERERLERHNFLIQQVALILQALIKSCRCNLF